MMKIRLIVALFVLLISQKADSQQTVGLFYHDTLSYEGITLFAPMSFGEVFLIDNCGRTLNSWETGTLPNFNCALLEDGSMLTSVRQTTGFFTEGEPGGIMRRYDWEGNLIWEFLNPDSNLSHHHDFEIMPNGNILVVTYSKLESDEVIANGRDADFVPPYLAALSVIEYEPNFPEGATEVWRWNSVDHLVQDLYPEHENFGSVSASPEKINFNYGVQEEFLLSPDWLHTNSIDYNEELDQIMLSVRNFSEVWVIDHSTTTVEAAGSVGGTYNKGGDLLYRWGNPEAYNRGSN